MHTFQEFEAAVRKAFNSTETLPDGRPNLITEAWSQIRKDLTIIEIVAIDHDAAKTEPQVAYYRREGAHEPILTFFLKDRMTDLRPEEDRRREAAIASHS